MKFHELVQNLKLKKYPDGDITQWFGENPELYSRWGLAHHNGIDIVRKHGEPLYAMEDGKIVRVKHDPEGFGKHVILRSKVLDDGVYRCWVYAHVSEIHVKEGEDVKAGRRIADMGNTGFVVSGGQAWWGGKNPDNRGTHLHLGLRLLKPDRLGWKYKGDDIKYQVVDYNNGVKGAIDPYPYLLGSDEAEKYQMMKQVLILAQRLLFLKKWKLSTPNK